MTSHKGVGSFLAGSYAAALLFAFGLTDVLPLKWSIALIGVATLLAIVFYMLSPLLAVMPIVEVSVFLMITPLLRNMNSFTDYLIGYLFTMFLLTSMLLLLASASS